MSTDQPVEYVDDDGTVHVWGFHGKGYRGVCDSCIDPDPIVSNWSVADVEKRVLVLTLCERCFATWLDAMCGYALRFQKPPGGWRPEPHGRHYIISSPPRN